MNNYVARLLIPFKVVRQLGPSQAFWYAVYQAGLRSGFYRRATPAGMRSESPSSIRSPFVLPDRQVLQDVLGGHMESAIAEADELVSGQVRLFGGSPVPLTLVPPDARRHWTYYEGRPRTWGVEDIKLLWEPARFGWAYTLGRAYLLTGDEKYPAAFWENFTTFLEGNPPNQGPNWASAQEVALRLLALLFAARAFQPSPRSTPGMMDRLAQAAAAHAARIPPTLSYARAQNNNHQVSEALGLFAAGTTLADHPQSARWRELGAREMDRALQKQIQPDGAYAQHSMNYHRLVLHAALQATLFGHRFPPETQQRLAAAAAWLLAQVDPRSGSAPNLGSNDGANILPLAAGGFADYRPVGQAAARAFLGRPALAPGPWDELSLWLGLPLAAASPAGAQETTALPPLPESPAVHRLENGRSWATLRAVQFQGRPSHADQLHVDLWWDGENIALDAGTYRYTAPPPWDNVLAETLVHNTVEVNHQSQMQRAGRFLWLDWAQAAMRSTPGSPTGAVAALHNGYQRLGVLHRRVLKANGPGRWQVIDSLLYSPEMVASLSKVYTIRLHWLLPDWPWAFERNVLVLDRPSGGSVQLTISPEIVNSAHSRLDHFSLVRAGEALVGPREVHPALGWVSPTYNQKIPALSLSVQVQSPLPLNITSDWLLEP
jgi:hypothetical protein